MRHDIESCDQGGEDQDKTWLDGPVASVKGKCTFTAVLQRPAFSTSSQLIFAAQAAERSLLLCHSILSLPLQWVLASLSASVPNRAPIGPAPPSSCACITS